MAAYMFISAIIKDRDAFIQGYSKATAPLVEKFGGRYVMRGPGATLLEGDFGDGGSVVISEWPNKQAALDFWNSPEYQEAKKLRADISDCQVLLVEGPKFTKDEL